MFTVGGDYSATPKLKPLCACTEHGHQAVREAIRDHHLVTISQVMSFMEWRTPNGCATCRPALNYYLISTWPHEAKDDPQSRFINERSHANIQKDGTYSVVPRMPGGEVTPEGLIDVGQVAKKYGLYTKITGGQRVDLFGARVEQRADHLDRRRAGSASAGTLAVAEAADAAAVVGHPQSSRSAPHEPWRNNAVEGRRAHRAPARTAKDGGDMEMPGRACRRPDCDTGGHRYGPGFRNVRNAEAAM